MAAPFLIALSVLTAFQPTVLAHGGTSTVIAREHRNSTISAFVSLPSSVVVWVTAYSSTPEETDETPHITASGTGVRDGIVATNMLPFGTKIKIPELFGDKVFTVEDRMHPRKKNFVDVWMPTKEAARRVGISYTEILVFQ